MHLGLTMLRLSRPVVTLIILGYYLASVDSPVGLKAIWTISAAFFLASSFVITGLIPAPRPMTVWLHWTELLVAMILTWTAQAYFSGGPMHILYFPILFTTFVVLPRRLILPAVLATLGAYILTSLPDWLTSGMSHALVEGGINMTLMIFAVSCGMLIRNLEDEKTRSLSLLRQFEESQGALERAHRQLRDSVSQEQSVAVLQERQRLAREIHDSVAHSLTALVVQIQAGRRLLTIDPEQAVALITRSEDLARAALQETRGAVRALHPSGLEQLTEVEALHRLGRDFGLSTGIEVVITADEESRRLSHNPNRLEHLYRIMQEALTNAHRHGQAKRVTADLSCTGDRLILTIDNDGAPMSQTPEPGLGLRSMSERVRALGGDFALYPSKTGLQIRVSVPIQQGVGS